MSELKFKYLNEIDISDSLTDSAHVIVEDGGNIRRAPMNQLVAGGGASVQADMAQNDPAQPDYVKNRTHWVEGSFEEILPETTLTMSNVSGYGMGGMITVDHTKIISGKTYKMVWDGVTYEAPAFEAVGQEEGGEVITAVAIGNPALANVGEDNGIPFCGSNIITGDMPTDDFAVLTTDTADTHTLSISAGSTTYHPLDEAFIPDTIARSASSHGLKVADAAGEAPTAAEFNALLAALREAGYLAT